MIKLKQKKKTHNTPKGVRTAGLEPFNRVAEKTCLGGFIVSSEIDELAMMMMMNDGMRKLCALGSATEKTGRGKTTPDSSSTGQSQHVV